MELEPWQQMSPWIWSPDCGFGPSGNGFGALAVDLEPSQYGADGTGALAEDLEPVQWFWSPYNGFGALAVDLEIAQWIWSPCSGFGALVADLEVCSGCGASGAPAAHLEPFGSLAMDLEPLQWIWRVGALPEDFEP